METKKQTKIIASILIIFGLMFLLPLVSSVGTWNRPTVGSNQSTTMTVNVTAVAADCSACLNATIYYNASGGAAVNGVRLTAIVNDTANDLHFYSTSITVPATDGTTYNFTARLYNATGWVGNSTSAVFTIDNTAPTGTLSQAKTTLSALTTQDITWTSTDATSTVQTPLLTIISPDTERCATYTSSSASSTVQRVGSGQTSCAGTYTVTFTATDYAGNVFTADTLTFKVNTAGQPTGAGSSGGVGVSAGAIGADDIKGKLNGKVIGFILLAIVIYFAYKKK